jgi:hypothetical protein
MWLDDVRDPPADGQHWMICRTVAEAIRVIAAGEVEQASLDHDLGICDRCTPGEVSTDAGIVVVASLEPVCAKGCLCDCHKTGYDFVLWMAEHERWPRTKPHVHSANPVGAAAMRQVIERYWSSAREPAERQRAAIARSGEFG